MAIICNFFSLDKWEKKKKARIFLKEDPGQKAFSYKLKAGGMNY